MLFSNTNNFSGCYARKFSKRHASSGKVLLGPLYFSINSKETSVLCVVKGQLGPLMLGNKDDNDADHP